MYINLPGDSHHKNWKKANKNKVKIMKENEEGDEENERLLYLHKNIETKLAKFAVVPHAGTWIEILARF